MCARDHSVSGCGVVVSSPASFGAPFNALGGGVYAMKWDNESIDVWFFARSAIPTNIINGQPDPATWEIPSASLSGQGCPIDSHFRNQALMFGV